MAVLASIGTAGVPGVGLVMLTIVLSQVDLPIEGIALVLGLDRLMDMIRAAVNISDDAVVTAIVAKTEGSWTWACSTIPMPELSPTIWTSTKLPKRNLPNMPSRTDRSTHHA